MKKINLQPIIRAAIETFKSRYAGYPPKLPRHRGRGFYQRGRGPGYLRLDGTTAWGRKTSERMGANWRIIASRTAAILYNPASYAQYVVGKEQCGFHNRHGWPQMFDKAEEYRPEFERILKRYAEKQLERSF